LKKKRITSRSSSSYWLTISDVMSGLFLFMMLLVLVALQESGQLSRAKAKWENTVGIRKDIIKEIKGALENEGIEVTVNEKDGTISLKDEIFFDYGKTAIIPTGQEVLKKAMPTISKIIFSNDDYIKNVIAIEINGYASEYTPFNKTYSDSMMVLSLSRSEEIWRYTYNLKNFPHHRIFFKKLKVSGWGNQRANSVKDNPKDRRVEFGLKFYEPWEDIMGIDQYEDVKKGFNQN